jgi:hypothetical protein
VQNPAACVFDLMIDSVCERAGASAGAICWTVRSTSQTRMSCARFCRSGSACRGTFSPTRELSSLTTDSLLCYLAVILNTTNYDDGMVTQEEESNC